jgi:ABC-type multidrug transport system fused ATPase/permease subunit
MNIVENKKLYYLYAIFIFAGLIASAYTAFKITPIADDYWYAALIREHGLVGGVAFFLETQGGLVFKELVIFTLVLPIAYLPIGIGSGTTHLLVALIVTACIVFLIANFNSEFWKHIQKHDKVFITLLVAMTYFVFSGAFYKSPNIEFLWMVENQSYDLIFWTAVQIYYLAIPMLFLVAFVKLEQSNFKKSLMYGLTALLGLAIGTTNYTLVGIFLGSIVLWNLVYKLKSSYVFNYKIKHPIIYIVSTLVGVAVSFSFPSNFKRAENLIENQENRGIVNYFEELSITVMKHFASSLANPGMWLTVILIAGFALIFLKNLSSGAPRFFKISLLMFIASILALVVAFILDYITGYAFWHYNHSALLIRLSSVFLALGVGVKLGDSIQSNLTRIVIVGSMIISIFIPVIQYIETVETRAICWNEGPCRFGTGEDIEAEWVNDNWLILEEALGHEGRGK